MLNLMIKLTPINVKLSDISYKLIVFVLCSSVGICNKWISLWLLHFDWSDLGFNLHEERSSYFSALLVICIGHPTSMDDLSVSLNILVSGTETTHTFFFIGVKYRDIPHKERISFSTIQIFSKWFTGFLFYNLLLKSILS